MDKKARLLRSIARATCDKPELDRAILRLKKHLDEANAVLCGKGKRKK